MLNVSSPQREVDATKPTEDLDGSNNNSSYSGNKREEPSVDATKPAEDLDSNNNNSSYSGNKVCRPTCVRPPVLTGFDLLQREDTTESVDGNNNNSSYDGN